MNLLKQKYVIANYLYQKKIINRGGFMLELEENKRILNSLGDKIKSVGDSLWHC